MKTQKTWLQDQLRQAARRGDTSCAHWLIMQRPAQALNMAQELEELAKSNQQPDTAAIFNDLKSKSTWISYYSRDRSLAEPEGSLNFTPSPDKSEGGPWIPGKTNNGHSKTKGIKMLCMFALHAAQELGLLERRTFSWNSLYITAGLPIKRKPFDPLVCPGRNPTYIGRHPDALKSSNIIVARVGTSRYNELMARELNQLSQDKLRWIATNMARFLDDRRALARALEVIDYDPTCLNPTLLSCFFGDNGPLNLEDRYHVAIIKRFLTGKPELRRFLGPKLTAVML
jgi:hypothetical protein